jgi:tetratricopeptide (TPR) repeat protein
MRHTRTCMIFLMVAALFLFVASPVLAQPKGGALMTNDVFTPIAKGYDLVRDGKYDAAKFEFETALKKDRYNPFALNNLAVLSERAGKLNDALAFLTDATTHADAYKDKVSQTCFVGGGCLAVKPVKGAASHSEIAPIIQDNIKKLHAKMAAQKTPPPPGSPPPVVPPPKTK